MALSDYLSQLKSEGSFDSSGRFSLDSRLMLEKLSRFQFDEPHQYLLPLISGLARLEPSEVHFNTGLHSLSLEAHCHPLSTADLRGLLDRLGEPDQDLALGLLGASRQFREVTLVSFPPEGPGARWRLRRTSVEVDRVEPGGRPGQTCILLQRSGSQVLKALTSGGPLSTLSQCAWAPFEILFNGAPFGQHPLDGQGNLSLELEFELPQGPVTGLVGLSASQPGLWVVAHGVTFETGVKRLPFEARAVVWADHLNRGLSWRHLVADEALDQLVEQLIAEIDRALLLHVGQLLSAGGRIRHLHRYLLTLVQRRPNHLPEELLKLPLLHTTRHKPVPVGLALEQPDRLYWGKSEIPDEYEGRPVFHSSRLLEALPVDQRIELVVLRKHEPPVPARLPDGPVRLPFDRHWDKQSFNNLAGIQGEAGIPHRPCTPEAFLMLYRNGSLVPSASGDIVPPGLDLIVEVGAQLGVSSLVYPELTKLYRRLVGETYNSGQASWALTYLLGYLLCAARLAQLTAPTPLDLGMSPFQALLFRPRPAPEEARDQWDAQTEQMDLRYFCYTKMLPTGRKLLSVADVARRGEPLTDLLLTPLQSTWLRTFLSS